MLSVIRERPEERENRALDQQKKNADRAVEAYASVLFADLKERLTRGELIARGFREPIAHGAPYRTISRHEWRVIELKLPDRAEGGGISYIGLTIGKPGGKRLFRRGGLKS